MAMNPELAPISAVLALGTIAGAGQNIARQQAKQMQDQQLAVQIAQQNIQAQQQAEAQQRQLYAESQSNQIQSALEFLKLEQAQQATQAALAQRKAEFDAQTLLAANQFNQRQDLAEKKFLTEQQTQQDEEASVNRMIDQLHPVGTPENMQAKLQYKATGRLPAQARFPARDMNAVLAYRKTLLDPIALAVGEEIALPGKEAELSRINSVLSQLAGEIGASPTAPQFVPPDAMMSGQQGGEVESGTVYRAPDGTLRRRR